MAVTIITNAPEAYDYEGTVLTSTVIPGRFKLGRPATSPFRKLDLDDRGQEFYADYQMNRYRSGLYLVFTPEQWEWEIANGYIVLPDRTATLQMLRDLPLRDRYSVALSAGVIGRCCPDCGCYVGTCHEWDIAHPERVVCTCPDNPDNDHTQEDLS